jgi:hypothetical protein
MVRQPVINFTVPLDYLGHTAFQAAHNFFFVFFFYEGAVNDKKIFTMAYILGADRVKVALAKTEVVNGVQDICFSDAVIPDKTIDLCIKLKFTTIKILVIEER